MTLSRQWIGLALSSFLIGPACTSAPKAPAPKVFAEDTALGFKVDDFAWEQASEADADGDGDPEFSEDGDVEFGGETHDVDVVNEVDTNGSDGGKSSLTVTDQKSGNVRIFTYNPTQSSIEFADGQNAFTVVHNPDGSYLVDDAAAANGKAAVALLKNNPVYRDASAWGFIMTYSVCQKCFERSATRGTVSCANGLARAAATPAVCDVFRDFCDCAVCDKAGKTSCASCP